MKKSVFVKYLLTFMIIIILSFSVVTLIFSTMIRMYSAEDRDTSLIESAAVISTQIEQDRVEDLSRYVTALFPSRVIGPMVALNPQLDILICDGTGKVLLTTVGTTPGDEPEIYGKLGSVDMSLFTDRNYGEGTCLRYEGSFSGVVPERSRMYAMTVRFNGGDVIGYVIALRSMAAEDTLVNVVRGAIFTSSVWVTLATVVAVYFVTERMMRPLREITGTTKAYAKGDFSTRVRIYGDDEIAELGRSFNNMADALEKTEVMRNSFLANISHDLRTPMTTIAGFIDGINSGAIPQEKQGYYLNVISSEVHRLSRLVSEILDVSRLESGERKFTFVDFDIAECARIILISFEQKIEEKKLEVEFLSDDAVYVKADKDAIYQVIYNLCHNAIKFSRAGGRFRIKIERTDNEKVRFRVYDDGQTIPETEIPFVFDRFYKTDKSRGLDKNGVGLGLYICQTIVAAHGEKIDVHSTADGCEFTFTLKAGEAPTRKS